MRLIKDNQTQKPRLGLLVLLSIVVFAGAGCESVSSTTQFLQSQASSAIAIIQQKIAELQSVLSSVQQTYGKAKAVYDILNTDSADTTVTPSAQPNEGQPQPAIEENTSSQSQPLIPDESTDQSL